MIRAWVLDDEPLAVRRLARLLEETGRVEIAGSSSDPEETLRLFPQAGVESIFLDIEMPGMNGFEFLERLGNLLERKPSVVFTTAYAHYAVRAFEVDGAAYLLKPISPEALSRALDRVEKRSLDAAQYETMLRALRVALAGSRHDYPTRIASKLGDRVQFIELDRITHFFVEGKLTWAAASGKKYVVDDSIVELEAKLDPAKFHRIHRSFLVNLGRVDEVVSWFGGRMVARMNDPEHTELPVARDRVRTLKQRLGF
jgi:two-component system, LytTR family, response regulator